MNRFVWSGYAIVVFWASGVLSGILPGHAPAVFTGLKFLLLLPACIYLFRRITPPRISATRTFDSKLPLLLTVWFLYFIGIHVFVEDITFDLGLLAYCVVTTFIMVTIEELIFRGITFSHISEQSLIRRKQYTSSLYFAVLHAFNLLYTGQLGETLSQIIMAFGMGMFLSSVYLRYGHIIYPIALHFMVNIVTEYKLLLSRPPIRMSALADYHLVVDERVLFSLVAAAGMTGMAYAILPGNQLRHEENTHSSLEGEG